VEVHGKCSYVPKAVPDCTPDSQIYWLQLDCQTETIKIVHLRHICIDRAQRTGDLPLACDQIARLWQFRLHFKNEGACERVREPNLRGFLLAIGQFSAASNVFSRCAYIRMYR